MVITNEYEYVKDIMETKILPKDISNKRLLLYIAKYYYSDEIDNAKRYRDFVLEKMKEFNLSIDVYQEYKYADYVFKICKKLLKQELSHEFQDVKEVYLYQSELDVINRCEKDREKKVVFTLFILAKLNDYNSGWVNNELKDIFQLANVSATSTNRVLMLHELYKQEIIGQSHRNDKFGYKVELGRPDEPIVMTVCKFKDLGNQFVAQFKPGWKMCEECGKLYKIKSKFDYSSKYCKQCARDKKLETQRQCMKKLRENEKRE